MTNSMKKFSLILAGLLLCASSIGAFGQTLVTYTTLSNALGGPSDVPGAGSGLSSCFVVASATGITAPTLNNPQSPSASTSSTVLYVDREAIDVTSVSSTTICGNRGVDSTAARGHASGAVVAIIPAYLDTYSGTPYGYPPAVPSGSCTRVKELILPRIQFVSGIVSDCLNGQWVNGDSLGEERPMPPLMSPPIGATIQTAIDTNGQAIGAATDEACTQVFLPASKYLTGLALLNGTTVGTNKWLYILRDSAGIPLANTAVAGTLTANASTYQQIAFTSPFFAVGPAIYYACLQANGTTDTYRAVLTGGNNGLYAGYITGQTFGTIVNPVTVPTTFTSAQGGYWEFY
jgi:hypothetical protein